MSPLPNVSVLIPAYNEEDRITQTIKHLSVLEEIKEIIVVDDGSEDNTGEKAAEAGARVIRLPTNRGKGTALNSGAAYITGEIVMLLDADLGLTAGEAQKLIYPIVRGEADIVIAKFPEVKIKSGFGLVKKLAYWGVYFLSGVKCSSVLSGQRAMTIEVFKKMLPFSKGYSVEVAATIKAAKMGYKIVEIPVNMSHRVTGRNWSGFYHRGRQFFHILSFFLKQVMGRC